MTIEQRVFEKINRRKRREENDRRWLIFRKEFDPKAMMGRASRAKKQAQWILENERRRKSMLSPDLKTHSRWRRFKEKIIKKTKQLWHKNFGIKLGKTI